MFYIIRKPWTTGAANAARRAAADCILFTAVFLLPWWAVFIAAGALFFAFERYYYEWFVVALLLDLVYGTPLARYHGFQFALSLSAMILSLAFLPLKRRMRF